jgi:hypothetical protein
MHASDTDRPMTSKERTAFAAALAILLSIAAASNAGCDFRGLSRPQPAYDWVDRGDTASSTFKIEAQITTQSHADEGGSDAPEVHHRGWTGTAWVGASAEDRAYLITAGHVCETRRQIKIEPDILGQLLGEKASVEDVLKVEYTIIAADGTRYGGATALEDDDDVDVCVLSIGAHLGRALPIADADPAYGAKGWYVGAPRGIWGNGLAGVFDVTYSGRAAPFKGSCDMDAGLKKLCDADGEIFTGDFAPGASGSPILVDGRVVGLMNLSPPSFPSIGASVPWDVVRRVLSRALHE